MRRGLPDLPAPPVAYLHLPRRGPCWLHPTGPGKGRRAFGRRPGRPGLGDPGSARAGVPGARRPQSGCGGRCAYLHGVAGHVLAPPARGPRAEGGVAGKARVRPARGVKGGKGAGTAGPRPGARPARPAPLRPRLTRPPRPRAAPSGPSGCRARHVTAEVGARGGGGAEGRGSRRPLGLRGSAGPAPPLRGTSSAPHALLDPLRSEVLHLVRGNPKRVSAFKAGSGGLWVSRDPSKNKQFISLCVQAQASWSHSVYGNSSLSAREPPPPHCLQASSGQIWVQIPVPHA